METGIRDWLQRKRTLEAPLCWLGSIGLVVAGLVVLVITAYVCFFSFLYGWWGIAALCEIVTGYALPGLPFKLIGWFTAGFMVLLFIGAARSTWWERGAIPKGVWSIYSNRDNPPSASATAIGIAKFATDILYSGPRLLLAAWRSLLKALRLWQLDVEHCAGVLGVVLAAHHAVPREKLSGHLAPACDWAAVERQLKDIDGVVFLEGGISLTSDLRAELVQVIQPSPDAA